MKYFPIFIQLLKTFPVFTEYGRCSENSATAPCPMPLQPGYFYILFLSDPF